MKKPALSGLVLSLVLAFGAAGADALAPEHERGVDGPFPDQVCGIPGTATVRFNIVGTDLGNNTSFDRGGSTYVFTATATGKSLTIHGAGSGTHREIIDATAGTITFIETGSGLPEQIKATHGRVLLRDVGHIVGRVRVFEYDPVTEEFGDLISDTWEFLAGPHPDLESGFTEGCAVITAYLLDP